LSPFPSTRKKQEERKFQNTVAKCVGFFQMDFLIKINEFCGKNSTSWWGENTKDCCGN